MGRGRSTTGIREQRVWLEFSTQYHLEANQVSRMVELLLAALVATDPETKVQDRR